MHALRLLTKFKSYCRHFLGASSWGRVETKSSCCFSQQGATRQTYYTQLARSNCLWQLLVCLSRSAHTSLSARSPIRDSGQPEACARPNQTHRLGPCRAPRPPACAPLPNRACRANANATSSCKPVKAHQNDGLVNEQHETPANRVADLPNHYAIRRHSNS